MIAERARLSVQRMIDPPPPPLLLPPVPPPPPPLSLQRMIPLPPPLVPALSDLIKARHHVDVELI